MHPLVGMMHAMYNAMETESATAAAAAVPKPELPKLSLTERVLYHMLTENTGCDILDSGGAYGRSWQRNQGRAIWNEPETTLEFSVRTWDGKNHLEINVTHSVFHWLKERLEYDRPMNRKFQKFANREENRNNYDLENMENFPKWLTEQTGEECTGYYGDGDPLCINTYNNEDLLSQTIQYVFFGFQDEYYVLLQIHGGCDVRGGYTAPKVFKVGGNTCSDETCMFDNARATIYLDYAELQEKIKADEEYRAQNPVLPETDPKWHSSPLREYEHANWYSDDGCHRYYDGACGGQYTSKQLDKMPCKAIETKDEWEFGTVCVLPDGTGLCPFTGCVLHASFY